MGPPDDEISDGGHFEVFNAWEVLIMDNKKWAVVFEYDLRQGLCVLARKDAGEGEVALFDSKEEAEEWVESSGEIDTELFEINYVSFTV